MRGLYQLIAVSILIVATSASFAFAADDDINLHPLNDVVKLDKPHLDGVQLSPPVWMLQAPPLKTAQTGPDELSVEDTQNLTTLWQTVLTKNTVIQYGLKQLATPPELRYAHSSIMSRALGGLLSGAQMLPYVFGADQYTAGLTTMGTNLVDHAVRQTKKLDPNQLPTDTDLVELSSLVQSLQCSVVQHYFDYKNNLLKSVQLQQLLSLMNDQQTPEKTDGVEIVLRAQLKNTLTQEVLKAHQEAKVHYLALERLVGIQGMRMLRFEDSRLTQIETNKVTVVPEPIQLDKQE